MTSAVTSTIETSSLSPMASVTSVCQTAQMRASSPPDLQQSWVGFGHHLNVVTRRPILRRFVGLSFSWLFHRVHLNFDYAGFVVLENFIHRKTFTLEILGDVVQAHGIRFIVVLDDQKEQGKWFWIVKGRLVQKFLNSQLKP